MHSGKIHSLLPTYLGAMSRLGDKLKAILVQFPPSLDARALDAVARLIKMLPKDTWFAMEFRHGSWFEGDTGISLVQDIPSITIAGSIHPSIQPFIQETGDFYLFRFIGDREISSFGHITKDRSAQVKEIHEAIQREMQDIRDAFVFFNNHYAGFAPASASQYMEFAGMEAIKFPVPRSGQASLFDFDS
ncbi:DUF72 domain-containing protein [Candidatus Bathyarchaeota archaeon]|nr:DUF72 domain-containing protein [Candidatus Bathyarchaeota archaeon]